ncbi:MAG: GAF domain-containing protein [bacterium]
MSDHHLSTPKRASHSFGRGVANTLDAWEFPFKCLFSLSPLIDFWHERVAQRQILNCDIAEKIQEELHKAPELLRPIEDFSVIAKHRELVDTLMSVVFPPAFWNTSYSAAIAPFHLRSFYATPPFERMLVSADGTFRGRPKMDVNAMASGRLLRAYLHIAKKFYGLELDFDYPMIFTFIDPETGLERHFKMHFDPCFVETKMVGEPKPLTGAARDHLLANLNDLNLWMELIPPEQFEFHGFAVINAVDVTDQEVLSSLKRDLIEKESILSNARFISLQERLRALLRRPHVTIGLAAIQGNQVFVLNYGSPCGSDCIASQSRHYSISDFAGSLYTRAVAQGETIVIEDLTTYPNRSSVEDEMIQYGVRNMVVAPLYYQDELIGTLDLKSPNPGDLNELNAMKLVEVLPLFSMAIKRSMEELNHRVQAVIKERCTAIHPAVEWRFRKAAISLIQKQDAGIVAEIEPIVFDEVYPLYGVTDIRGSSTQRNAAIQADLIDQLSLANEIVLLARSQKPLPFLDELAYRIDKMIAKIVAGVSSGDEVTILDFLNREVESLFNHLQEFGAEVRERIHGYRAALDTQLKILYRKRKDFEESVAQINETLSAYLEDEEEKAQAMFPHYFEKHKSDGIDHVIYLGASLVEDRKFDLLYLKNLRLWQLMVACGMARQAERLKETLKAPLETAHLILVQNTPLSIRFRFDEKQFDVDGAYNIRYEIMKKRIDKATIKGTSERLTQPGKIAIVYSHDREVSEYRRYIDYLQASGYLTEKVEEVELEDLQGVQGLRALRVTVDMQTSVPEGMVVPEEVEEAVKALFKMAS